MGLRRAWRSEPSLKIQVGCFSDESPLGPRAQVSTTGSSAITRSLQGETFEDIMGINFLELRKQKRPQNKENNKEPRKGKLMPRHSAIYEHQRESSKMLQREKKAVHAKEQ